MIVVMQTSTEEKIMSIENDAWVTLMVDAVRNCQQRDLALDDAINLLASLKQPITGLCMHIPDVFTALHFESQNYLAEIEMRKPGFDWTPSYEYKW